MRFSVRTTHQGPLMRTDLVTKTPTEPRGGHKKDTVVFDTLSDGVPVDPASGCRLPIERALPIPRDDEPNLYNFPDSLHPSYRSIPLVGRVLLALLSICLSAISTWGRRFTLLSPLLALRTGIQTWNKRRMSLFLLKVISTWLATRLILQDTLLGPSRISTSTLFEKYYLPSALSCYDPVVLPGGASLGVHYLRYQSKLERKHPFRAVYVNHGFGASSLSWLPALPSLVDRLGARVGLGHDAPGFGYTDRPDRNRTMFSIPTSAAIGSALLSSHDASSGTTSDAVVLFGHSMGATGTLRMALALPTDTMKRIVLVAPALGLRSHSTTSRPVSVQRLADWTRPGRSMIERLLVVPIASYGLRSLVGRKGFWKDGLRLAWGDPDKVSDSDALRFQWPSIGKGWERGLLAFAGAQFTPPNDKLTDQQLMERVLADENATVAIIRGTADRIVPIGAIDKFLEPFASKVTIVDLDGQGHDPFEEQVDTFVDTVEELLNRQIQTR